MYVRQFFITYHISHSCIHGCYAIHTDLHALFHLALQFGKYNKHFYHEQVSLIYSYINLCIDVCLLITIPTPNSQLLLTYSHGVVEC